jgi:hypothetical protein
LQLATWLRQQGAAWPLCLWHTSDADQLLCWKLDTFKWAVTAGAYPYAWREQWTSSATAIATAATAAAAGAAAGGVDEAAAAAAAAEPAVDSSSNSSNCESRMCAALKAAGYEDVVAWVHSLEAPPCNCVQSSPAAAVAAAAAAVAADTSAAAAADTTAELLDDFQPCLHHCSKQQAV